jgi:CRP-like cAMP-binding protein
VDPISRALKRVVDDRAADEAGGQLPRRRPPGKYWALQRTKLFDRVSRERIEAIADASNVVVLARRKLLDLDAMDPRVYVLLEGSAKLCRVGLMGRKLIEAILEPGDLFGRVAATGEEETAFLETLEKSRVLGIPRGRFTELMAEQPDFALEVVQLLEQRERKLRRRIENLVFKDVTARLVDTLLELATEVGESCTHGFAIDVRVSQQDLADLVGASRQMINRILGRLTRDLYLKRKGKFMCILHLERLQRLASETAASPDEP